MCWCVESESPLAIKAECAAFTGKRGEVVKCGTFINAVIVVGVQDLSGVQIAAEMFGFQL